jgi:hypothetical protein
MTEVKDLEAASWPAGWVEVAPTPGLRGIRTAGPACSPRSLQNRTARSGCATLTIHRRDLKDLDLAATLRFLQFLSLGCWVGSIIFFIVLTAGIFSVIPTKDLTGVVVGYSLGRLHTMGLVAGLVYLIATVLMEKSVAALARPAALLVFAMIVCTTASQYGVIARMDALRAQMGSVDATPADMPLRVAFDRLHQYSVRLESAVLLSGLVALFLTARQKSS